VPEKNHGHVN